MKEVLVAGGATATIHIYKKSTNKPGELTTEEVINVGHFPDNIYTDQITGDYYSGVHKNPFKLLAVTMNQSRFTSSSGVRVYKNAQGKYAVEEVFHDSGRSFTQGAATLAHYKGQYLIGTVFDNLGYCSL